MTGPRHVDLSPARQRRMAWYVVLGSGLGLVLIVALYYALPLDVSAVGALIGLFVGLIAASFVLAHEIRKITISPFPALRAVGVLIVGVPLFVLLFASVYLTLATIAPGNFNQPLDRTAALYFAFTVFTTVGFGDIVPVTTVARVVTIIQMFLDLVAIGLGLKIILAAVQIGRQHQHRDAQEQDRNPPESQN